MRPERTNLLRSALIGIVMQFDTHFNIGDRVFVTINNKPVAVTIGKIIIEHTDSKGRDGEELFDNYKPQKSHYERYMCDETGVGTGNVWELGKNIFATKDECESAIDGI